MAEIKLQKRAVYIADVCAALVKAGYEDATHFIQGLPGPDVTPVRRGKWIYSEDDYESHINCSECGYEADYENFCPNCGAYMGGD